MSKKFLPENLIDNIHNYPFYKKIGDRDVFFIHIPKTGGTSITHGCNFPRPNPQANIKKHYRLRTIKEKLDPTFWEQAFKFIFVRNPWDRVFSHYRFRLRKNRVKAEFVDSFKLWLAYNLTGEIKDNMLNPQYDWIQSGGIVEKIDFVGRFENYENDFNRLTKILGIEINLPHVNSSLPFIDYRTVYDDEMIEIVRNFHMQDVEYFKYTFE